MKWLLNILATTLENNIHITDSSETHLFSEPREFSWLVAWLPSLPLGVLFGLTTLLLMLP